jgi:quercetin dioxygenase-like cupin family protein
VIVRRAQLDYRRLPGRHTADPFGEGAGDFAVRVVRLDGNDRRSPHYHPHSHEVIYVVRGKGALWEARSTAPFGEGDCALIPPGVPHATLPAPDTVMDLVCFFPHPDLPANTEELLDVVVREGRNESQR